MTFVIRKFLNRVLCSHSIKKYLLFDNFFSFERIFKINFPESSSIDLMIIGANDGVSFDSIFELVKKLHVYGIAIEPVQEYYDLLVENLKEYKKVTCLNFAVHKSDKNVYIYKVKNDRLKSYSDWAKGINSFNKQHLIKLNILPDDIDRIKISAVNMNYLIIKYFQNKERIYLQIDTEGYDSEIISDIDFNLFRPIILKYESVNLKFDELKRTENLLARNGYFVIKSKNDSLALDLTKVRLF